MMRTIFFRRSFWPGLLLAGVFTVCGNGLPAQSNVTFEAEAPTNEITEGSHFEVSFTLKNAAGKRFIAPDFKGFRVTGGPSEMRGAGFINGQSYSHQTWSFELEAGKPGAYTIGPAIVQTSAQTLRTLPLTVRVAPLRAGRTNAPPKSDDKVFVSGELDRETAWVGQQLRYQVKLYTQLSIADFDILELPQFEGFFSRERRRFDTRVQYQTIRGKKYAVRVLYELALFPQEPGDIVIGPARVRAGVEQPGSFSAILGATPVLLQTQPTRVRVNPLPDPQPPGFSGAVGRYKWKVEKDRETLSTDDALTLTVTVEGNGDARRFANPKIALPDGLEGFDPKSREEEEYETGDEFMHTKTLEYVILPKQPGAYTLRPELVIFDPDSNRYRTLRADTAIHLQVSPGQHFGQQNMPIDTVATPVAKPSPLAVLWKSIAPWLRSGWLWGSIAGTGMLAAVFLFVRRRRRQKRAVPVPEDSDRPRPSVKTSRERFRQVYHQLQQQEPRAFYDELLKAFLGYIATRLSIEPAQLSQPYLRRLWAERQAPEPVLTAVLQVWNRCEQAVYAAQARAGEAYATWQQAEQAIQEFEKVFPPKG